MGAGWRGRGIGSGVPAAPRRVKARTGARGLAAGGLALLLTLACASDIVLEGRGPERLYRHRERGYRIAAPADRGPLQWERRKIEGADLVFQARGDERVHLSLLSDCRKTRADAETLARTLAAGVPLERFRHRGPLAVLGLPGFTQTFDPDAASRVRTVTVVQGGCVFDWLLVAPRRRFDDAVPVFEQWWQSFERPEGGA